MIEDVWDILYVQTSIPVDALRTTARLWVLTDAAEQGIIIAAYVCYEGTNGSWSCSHLLGKGQLAPEHLTLPQKELQGLSSGADMLTVILNAIGEQWIEEVLVGTDSEISLCWVAYESVKLQVFNRNRVVNITRKINFKKLFHVKGKENCSDIRTRTDKVSSEDMKANSDWLVRKL